VALGEAPWGGQGLAGRAAVCKEATRHLPPIAMVIPTAVLQNEFKPVPVLRGPL